MKPVLVIEDEREVWPPFEIHTTLAEVYVTFADGKQASWLQLPDMARQRLEKAGARAEGYVTHRLKVSATLHELLR